MDDQQRRDGGMQKRRKILGDAWVDKSIKNRNAFFNTDLGPDHALCLGRDLDPGALRRAHAASLGHWHYDDARAMG